MYNKLPPEMDTRAPRRIITARSWTTPCTDYIAAGYVTGMGDKDARYYTAKQYLEYLNQQNGVVMGVGADVIKDANGYARIVKVYPNSPAEESGLQKNFYITKVGELDVKTLSLLAGEQPAAGRIRHVGAAHGGERHGRGRAHGGSSAASSTYLRGGPGAGGYHDRIFLDQRFQFQDSGRAESIF